MKTTKKLMKRIVAMICSLAMVLSLVNVSAFTTRAEGEEDATPETKLQVAYVGDEDKTVLLDEDVTLEVEASVPDDSDEITYQWYRYDSDSEEYKIMEDEVATSLVLEGLDESGSYKCVVTCGEEQAECVYNVKVICPFYLDYSEDFDEGEVEADDEGNVTMSVVVQESDDVEAVDLSYQWYSSDVDEDEWSEIDGATQASYTASGVTRDTDYKVVVIDSITGYEDELWFTVNVPGDDDDDNYEFWLEAVSDNDDEYVKYNQSMDYEVKVNTNDASEQFTYQWYFGLWNENEQLLSGETTSKLHVAHVTESGSYICRVTDSKGNIDDYCFHVEVDVDLNVKAFEDTVVAKPGTPIPLKVIASVDSGFELRYSWYAYDNAMDESIKLDSTTNVCTIPAYANAGTYWVECDVQVVNKGKVVNAVGVEFELFIYESELKVKQGAYHNALGKALSITATANQPITVKWYKENGDDEEDTYMSEGTRNGNTYSYTPNSAGDYYVSVESGDALFGYTFRVYDTTPISVGTASQVNAEAIKHFEFVPKTSGTYKIKFDEIKGEELENYEFDVMGPDGWMLSSTHFSWNDVPCAYVETESLKAGESYIISAWFDVPVSYKASVELLEACKHKNTEVRGATQPTCSKPGNTGDTYCKDCGDLVSKGKVIAATGKHSYVTTTIAATTYGAGSITYRCSACGYTYSQTIPKLSAPAATVSKPAKVKKAKAVKNGKKIKITWKKMSGIKGYKIQYSTAKNFKKKCKTMTVKSAKTTKKMTPTLKKGTYYIRICSYKVVKGKTYQSKWVNLKKIKIK